MRSIQLASLLFAVATIGSTLADKPTTYRGQQEFSVPERSYSTNQISAGYSLPSPSSSSISASQKSYNNADAPVARQPAPVYTGSVIEEKLTYEEPVEIVEPAPVVEERSDIVVEEEEQDVADDRSDVVSTSYEPAAPVATGNLYYYYYPVAPQPLYQPPPPPRYNSRPHRRQGLSEPESESSSMYYLLAPLLALMVAAPAVAMFGGFGGRSFDGGRASEYDNKFGSFNELQTAIDSLIVKYMNALESEECMDRVVCELGSQASSLPHKNMMLSVMEWLIGGDHLILGQGRLNVFRTAATEEFTMNKCRDTFRCNPPKELTTPTVSNKPANYKF